MTKYWHEVWGQDQEQTPSPRLLRSQRERPDSLRCGRLVHSDLHVVKEVSLGAHGWSFAALDICRSERLYASVLQMTNFTVSNGEYLHYRFRITVVFVSLLISYSTLHVADAPCIGGSVVPIRLLTWHAAVVPDFRFVVSD